VDSPRAENIRPGEEGNIKEGNSEIWSPHGKRCAAQIRRKAKEGRCRWGLKEAAEGERDKMWREEKNSKHRERVEARKLERQQKRFLIPRKSGLLSKKRWRESWNSNSKRKGKLPLWPTLLVIAAYN
jgi:hypothetical protein